MAGLLDFPQGAAFGTGSPAETAQQPAGLGNLLSGAYEALGLLAKRAIGNSQTAMETGYYNPAPVMDAALTVMGGAGVVPAGANELRAGYSAYKGMSPYHADSLPVKNWKGEIIEGANRTPREITSFDRPGAEHGGFFSSDPAVASRFAETLSKEGSVFPVNVELSKPLVIDAKGKPAAAFQFEAIAREHGTTDAMKQFRSAFKGSDYDGIILKNTADEGTVYVPRSGQQVSSKFK